MDDTRRSNEALLLSLSAALKQESVLVADVITMLIEIEDRRLHLELACSSMFDFCTRRLGLSEGQTFRRLAAARLARSFPSILDAIRSRSLHLSSIALLRDLFTADNVDDLIAAASGKPKSFVKDLVARLAPKPDAPTRIRQLPSPALLPEARTAALAGHDGSARTPSTHAREVPDGGGLEVDAIEQSARVAGTGAVVGLAASPSRLAPPARKIAVADQIVPLSESRHKIQFTASTELRHKLERAQNLMRHRNIDGDVAVVIERALDLLVAKLEKTRFAKTSRPKRTSARRPEVEQGRERERRAERGTEPTAAIPATGEKSEPSKSPQRDDVPQATVTAAVRREVVARDGERCTFTSPNGERCPAQVLIEIDHRHPRALGGDHTLSNLRLLCRAHNRYQAERVFGKAHVASAIERKKRKLSNDEPSAGASFETASPKQPSLPFE